ncbi:Yip1 family protein [Metabacillus sp. Hm71]|uniref:Yip1 family protein n=1 Tax=Metabacillus sp. Hm71 TaxID=3450743 RepID=UPI003F43FF96
MEQETIQRKKPSIFGMIFSPGEQLERIRERPVIWLPLILLTLVMTIIAVFSALNIDYSAMPGMEMSAEEEQMAKIFGVVGAGLVGFFGTPIGYLFFGLIFWAIAKVAKSDATFKQMFSLMIFTSIITTIGQILNQLIIFAIDGDPMIMLTSLNSLVGADGVLGAVLSTFEVFSIWYYIVLGMGLVKVAKLSKPAAVIITIVFFVLGIIIAAIGGAFEGMTQF